MPKKKVYTPKKKKTLNIPPDFKAKRKGATKQFKFTGLDNQEYTLTEQQKLFSETYIQPFMSSVEAVIEAGYDVYKDNGSVDANLARVIAHENLMKPNICQYITTLIDACGLNDQTVDKHLLFNITQYSDLKAKNTAIEIYSKMKGRFAPEKHEHSIIEKFKSMSDEELEDMMHD